MADAQRRVLITGGAGFVGSNICRAVAESDTFRFRALDLPSPRLDALRALGGEVVGADLLQPGALESALKGCAAVVHLVVAHEYAPASAHERVTIGGARRLVEAMQATGVRRLVFMSSIKAARDYPGLYGRSKRRTEAIIRESGLDYTIFRPGLLYGPGELKLSGMIRWLRKYPVFPLPGGDYRIYPVHVDDLARAVMAALNTPRAIGNTYYLAAEKAATLRQIVLALQVELGLRRPLWHVPLEPAVWLGRLLQRFQKQPILFVDQIRAMQARVAAVDTAPAQRDLGFHTPCFSTGLPRYVRWFLAQERARRTSRW
jgi:NADH dehydrogenase